MNNQLMLLLEIQDLHHQKAALEEEPDLEKVEEKHFKLDPEQAAAAIQDKIDELKQGLDPEILRRCERGLPALGRMVVPVIGGICYGCFESIPTARAVESAQNVDVCESCGRFIYILS